MNFSDPNAWTLSRVLGILSLLATILTFAATYLGQIDPQYSVIALAVAAAINAFTGRVQGTQTQDRR